MKAIALFLLAMPTSVSYAQSPTPKVAVLVSAGDLGQLEDSMKATEKLAIQTYEKLGFKVILVGGVNKTGVPMSAETLKKTLAAMRNVKDLRLDFIGHGGVEKMPSDYPASEVPFSRAREDNSYSPDELKKEGKRVWFAANSQNADANYYGAKAQGLGIKTDKLKPIDHVQVKAALAAFHKNNPETVATVNLLNCFSGVVAQELRRDPKTIVFANSPHNTVAVDYSDHAKDQGKTVDNMTHKGTAHLGSKNGLYFYYQIINGDYRLDSGDVSKADLPLDQARFAANGKIAAILRNDPAYAPSFGRSPSLESVIGWCEGGRPKALKSARDEKSFNAFETTVVEEVGSIRKLFSYSENVPSLANPKIRLVDELKASFAVCKANSKTTDTRAKGEVKKQLADARKMIAINKADPEGPMRHLVDTYDKILANPQNHAEIVKRFRDRIDQDVSNLKSMKLPEDRWGGLREIIDGLKSGKITNEWIISKLKSQAKDIRIACVDGVPFKAPCYPDLVFSNRDLGLTVMGMGKQEGVENDFAKCSTVVDIFSCYRKIDPQSTFLVSAIEKYWFAHETLSRRSGTSNDYCKTSDWLAYQRAKRNVELDEKCVSDFMKHAPLEEFENLERLKTLGARDARGYSSDPVDKTAKSDSTGVKR